MLANRLGALGTALMDATSSVASSRLSDREIAALVAVASYEEMTLERLGGLVALSQPATTHLVARLESASLVERLPGHDRRTRRLELTHDGRRAVEEFTADRMSALKDVVVGMTVRERAQLLDLVDRLLAALTNGRLAADRICRYCDQHACAPRPCPVDSAANARA
jgi:DNA-binding MarR family transcriptional regulator